MTGEIPGFIQQSLPGSLTSQVCPRGPPRMAVPDNVRQAAEERAFECYYHGLYETALSLMEAAIGEDADHIKRLMALADSYMKPTLREPPKYRSLGAASSDAEYRSCSAATHALHHSSSPADWSSLPAEIVLKILLAVAATGQHRTAFSAGLLVCKKWKTALLQEDNPSWREAFFAHLYGLERGSILEREHLEAEGYTRADGQWVPPVGQELGQGYWRTQYTEFFITPVLGYDKLIKQAVDKANFPDHVIEKGHVRKLIEYMCNITVEVAVKAPTPEPKGREACISTETKTLAHMFFNVIKTVQIPRGSALPSLSQFESPLFEVVRAVTDIWDTAITEAIDRISEKVQDLSSEHKMRTCAFVDRFIKSAACWLKYIDDLYAKLNVHRLLSCASIGNREAQRLRGAVL